MMIVVDLVQLHDHIITCEQHIELVATVPGCHIQNGLILGRGCFNVRDEEHRYSMH